MDNRPPSHSEEHQLEYQRDQQLLPKPIDRRALLKSLLAGVLTASAFGLGGFFLFQDKSGARGSVLFLLLPLASGFVTALVARSRTLVIVSLLIAVFISFGVLLATGKEGYVCVLMAAPILGAGLAVGVVAGILFRKYVIDKSRRPGLINLVVFLVAPFLLMGANSAEEPARQIPRTETVVSTLILDAAPEKVWQQIRSIDSLSSTKSFLMKIGLPVPVSCAMAGEGVGAKRTCYFDSGYIEERITEWNPPNSMKLDITVSTLPGRHWLGFKNASYDIRRENGHTILTRSSTIISRLSPAWYWSTLERLGVETEHKYLFEDFKKRIDGGK